MSSFSFRAEFDDGRSIEVVPTRIQPLGVEHIQAAARDPKSALKLVLFATGAEIDGVKSPDSVRVTANVIFHHPAVVYSLVPGGWLPMPLAIPPRFLVDRNVVAHLRRLRGEAQPPSLEAFKWWSSFFQRQTALFNPLPYAFESRFRRKPTFQEFSAAYEEGLYEIQAAIPGAPVVQFGPRNYAAAYSQLEAFDSRNDGETRFLRSVCPMIVDRVATRDLALLQDQILAEADRFAVQRSGLVSLAVLSCLYEATSGDPPSIGRLVLKPKQNYSDENAFNALSDLRHIELTAAGQAYFEAEAFSFCTSDRALAMFWSALGLRGQPDTNSKVTMNFEFSGELLSRLDDNGARTLRTLLKTIDA